MPTLSTVNGPGTAAENTLSAAVQDLQNYLGGAGNGSEHTFKTPAGDFTVKHYNPASENNGGPISLSGPVSGACTFKQTQTGTFTVITDKSTGKFTGATGHGDYTLLISGTGPAVSGQCKNTNQGPSVSKISTASINFTGTGPLTVKS